MTRYPAHLRAKAPFVSRETEARLEAYVEGLSQWAGRLNLIAGSTRDAIWVRHIEDSLAVLALAPDFVSWTDFGTGAGLPGMVVAAHAHSRTATDATSGSRVDLVESNRKKTAFLSAMRPSVCPGVHIHSSRIEHHVANHRAPQIVSARAVAALPRLLEMIEAWSDAGVRAIFPKGRGYADEIRDSEADWAYDLTVHDNAVEPGSVILDITNIRRRKPALL